MTNSDWTDCKAQHCLSAVGKSEIDLFDYIYTHMYRETIIGAVSQVIVLTMN